MSETLPPIIEKLEAEAKELGGESLEKMQTEWRGFLTLVDQALDAPGAATKAAAKRIIQSTIDIIKKYNAPAGKILQEDLEALLYSADQVEKFVVKLSSYSTDDLKKFMSENLQLPELSENQKYRVETLKILYTVVEGCRAKASENPDTSAYLEALLSELASNTRNIIADPGLTLGNIGHPLLIKLNELGKKIAVPGLSSLILFTVQSPSDLNKLRTAAIESLRTMDSYKEAQTLALDAFPKESAAAEKLARAELSTRWNEAYHHAQLELYAQFNSIAKQGEPPEKARAILDDAAKTSADQAMEYWRPLTLLQKMDISKLSPDQKLVWAQINDMGDYKNEWGNVSDLGIAISKEVFIQVATLVATILLPELVALKAIELSAETVILLRTGRMAKYAKALLGARSASLMGRAAIYSGELMVGQIAGEMTFKGARVAVGQETMSEALRGRPWLEDLLMGTALEVPMELAVLMTGGKLTLAKEILIGMTSSSLARFGQALVETGQEEACAYFFAAALKNGEYQGDPKKILAFCGPELYEMCGSPQL
jgi:hypothetical protein